LAGCDHAAPENITMHKTIRMLTLLSTATLLAGGALAQAQTFKFGAIHYQPDAKTSGLTGLGVPAGADVTVNSATTALLAYEREIAPNMGLELVLGLPPTIKAKASGTAPFLGEMLSAKNVAPTLFLNYHFGAAGSQLRPYLGVGINYTRFTGATSPYGWQVSLSDSWGLAAQAGVNVSLGKQWGLFASIGAAQVKTDLVAVGASVLRSSIDLRPVVYSAGVAYKF
jgi:outer membrane protein